MFTMKFNPRVPQSRRQNRSRFQRRPAEMLFDTVSEYRPEEAETIDNHTEEPRQLNTPDIVRVLGGGQ